MAYTVTRGRLTVPGLGVTKEFAFNPDVVTDAKGADWGSVSMPGASHPIYQYGTGGGRQISFSLYLDGDRSRTGRSEKIGATSLSVANEIRFYTSLLYPAANADSGGFAEKAPYEVVFNFGELYQDVVTIVTAASVSVNFWTPKLEPVRAVVAVTLAEQTTDVVIQSDVWPNTGWI